jgi:hypothetical protein
LPGSTGPVRLDIVRLGERQPVVRREQQVRPGNTAEPITFDVGALEPGGYSARVRIGEQPSARRDFACERGGDEWADSRPDEDRLRAISTATGGVFLHSWDAESIPLPPAT